MGGSLFLSAKTLWGYVVHGLQLVMLLFLQLSFIISAYKSYLHTHTYVCVCVVLATVQTICTICIDKTSVHLI